MRKEILALFLAAFVCGVSCSAAPAGGDAPAASDPEAPSTTDSAAYTAVVLKTPPAWYAEKKFPGWNWYEEFKEVKNPETEEIISYAMASPDGVKELRISNTSLLPSEEGSERKPTLTCRIKDKEVDVDESGEEFAWVRWSPDSRYAAYLNCEQEGYGGHESCVGNVYLYDTAAPSKQLIVPECGGMLHDDSLLWSPDGSKLIAVCAEPGNVYLYDVAGGELHRVFSVSHGSLVNAAWCRDGACFLFSHFFYVEEEKSYSTVYYKIERNNSENDEDGKNRK